MQILWLILILVMAFLLLCWIPLLVFGLVRWRRGHRSLGICCTVVGAAWGMSILIMLIPIGVGVLIARNTMKTFTPVEFDPANYAGPIGTLILDWEGQAELVVATQDGSQRYSLKSNHGQVSAPVGNFTLCSLKLTSATPAGHPWQAHLSPASRQSPVLLVIPAAGEIPFTVGFPFQAKVTAGKSTGGRQAYSLQVSDATGRQVTIHPPESKAPQLNLIDATGTILLKQNFEYG